MPSLRAIEWKRPRALLGLAVAVHVVLALASAAPGMHTGGDNAAYLALANSLATDGTYSEVWHPGSPPHTKYPPLYPGVLALLILLGAKTWGAFKGVSLVFTALATAFCFLWVERMRGPRAAVVAALLFGLAPAVLYSAGWILSEPLFLACTFAALWLLTPRTDATGDPPARTGSGGAGAAVARPASAPAESTRALSARDLALGVVLATAAYFSRSAGLPLVVAVAAWLGLGRRWKPLALCTVAFAAVTLPWQRRSVGGYVSELWMVNPYDADMGTAGAADLVRRVADNLAGYTLDHVPTGLTGMSGALAATFGSLLAAAALVGWFRRLRRGPGVAEIFFVLYAGLILLWPAVWSGDRFALPLFPLVVLYAGETVAPLAGRVLRRPLWAVGAAVGLTFLLPAGNSWLGQVDLANRCRIPVATFGPMGCYGSNIREFQAMALWTRDGLPDGSVVFSRKPRIFHVFSGHASVVYPFTEDTNSLFAHADSLGAGYLVLGNWDSTGPAYVHPVISAHPERFCVVAQLDLSAGTPISLLAIRPPPPDDAMGPTPAGSGVEACPRESPVPSNAAMASMIVPILDEP